MLPIVRRGARFVWGSVRGSSDQGLSRGSYKGLRPTERNPRSRTNTAGPRGLWEHYPHASEWGSVKFQLEPRDDRLVC
jgi:hypothetical protein